MACVKLDNMKFLHISDVHLGCTRYQLPESPRDFFDAWFDVLKRYAVGENVDFVIICGDFFHKRSVPPETMNYAMAGLSYLRDHNIPVVMIEGNHDQRLADSDHSWLRSLANWGLIKLLEPSSNEGKISYEQWNEETKRGGYIDIGRARIFGSVWYGASANWAIPMLTESITQNRREGAFHMLLLHTDVEGHQTHPLPALKIAALKELKAATEYVGLGHTHMHYEIDNWAFNPGSIEVTNISEFKETRGVFVVEVDEQNNIAARHIQDYRQRPFLRLAIEVNADQSPEDIAAAAAAKIDENIYRYEADKPQPIVEFTIRGRLGFPNSKLDMPSLREYAQKAFNALHVIVKNHSVPVEYAVAEDVEPDAARELLENRVIEDLVRRDNRYSSKAVEMAAMIVGVKRLALADEPPDKIADTVAEALPKAESPHGIREPGKPANH